MDNHSITVSTPGRICLFGEHQDYLGLPVIAAAISRRIQIAAEATAGPEVYLRLPDIDGYERFSLTNLPLPYPRDRDYFRSAVNVLYRDDFRFSRGITGEVRGEIPINAGASSSSALLVTWLNVLNRLADEPQPLTPEQLAELAYRAEVLEFGEPGGMMDHYATAVGRIIYLASQPAIELRQLQPPLGTFVLGDSGEPKDTIGILARVKHGMLRISRELTARHPEFSLHTTPQAEATEYRNELDPDDYVLLMGTLANRDLLREALTALQAPAFDHAHLGQLLTAHQANLRDAQRISTPKLDRMLDAARAAGALGGKINGSGGGGCMFVYAPNQPETVAEAIEQAGGRAYIISVAEGTTRIT